jgi:hypothetical protein
MTVPNDRTGMGTYGPAGLPRHRRRKAIGLRERWGIVDPDAVPLREPTRCPTR